MNLIDDVISAVTGNKESKLVSEVTLHIVLRGTEIQCEHTIKRGSAKCKNQDDAQKAFDHFEKLDAIDRLAIKFQQRITPPEKQPLDVIYPNEEISQPNVEEPITPKPKK